MSEARPALINCFGAVFPNLGPREIETASTASVAEWDSLAGATLITVVEEEFGFQLEPEEMEQFISFDLALEIVEHKAV